MRWLGLVGQASGSYETFETLPLSYTANPVPATIPAGKIPEQMYGFLGGIRIVGFGSGRVEPFAQFLSGVLHTHSPQTALAPGVTVEPRSVTQPAIAVGAGIDVKGNDRIALWIGVDRLQAFPHHVVGAWENSLSTFRLQTDLVFALGGSRQGAHP